MIQAVVAATPSGRALLERRPAVPLEMGYVVSDSCNFACQHCYQSRGSRPDASTAQAKAVIDRIAEAGVLGLCLSGGELSLRADLIELLEYARARGFAVRVPTNGSRIDEPLADRLAALHLVLVQVSVYSSRAAEHDQVTRVPGSWSASIAGLDRLASRGVPCAICWPVTTLCTCSYGEMASLAERLGVQLAVRDTIYSREDGGMGAQWPGLDEQQLEAFCVRARLDGLHGASKPNASELDQAPCPAGRSLVAVMSDGEVRPCSLMPTSLGSMPDGDLREMLGREHVRRFARATWRDLHGCRDCSLRPHCLRCWGDAGWASSDLLGPYPSACAGARARFRAALGRPARIGAVDSACEPGRDAALGPYAIVDGGDVLRPVADLRTEQDARLADLLRPLVRSASGGWGSGHRSRLAPSLTRARARP
jgi:radical SAM protein with 4Fe4S-binding SPASM domain